MMKLWRWCLSFAKTPQKQRIKANAEFDQLLQTAQTDYNAGIKQLQASHQIDRYAWSFNVKTRNLEFHHTKDKLPKLKARAEILGSYFIKTRAFEWSWNTPNVPKKLTRVARKVKRFGRCNGQPDLYTGRLTDKKQLKLCQYYAAIALHLSSYTNVYQGKSQDQIVFFLMRDIQSVED